MAARDNAAMTHNQHLEEYLALCKAVFEQMQLDGTWPWSDDSTKSDDMIESESNQNEL